MSMHWVAAIIGVALAATILYLVRRDHLHGAYAWWWLFVAAAALVMGSVPHVVDWLGHVTHIYYPPVLPIVVCLALVLVRLLKLDIDRSKQERRIRRLVQKMALLEEELARQQGAPEVTQELPVRKISDAKRAKSGNA